MRSHKHFFQSGNTEITPVREGRKRHKWGLTNMQFRKRRGFGFRGWRRNALRPMLAFFSTKLTLTLSVDFNVPSQGCSFSENERDAYAVDVQLRHICCIAFRFMLGQVLTDPLLGPCQRQRGFSPGTWRCAPQCARFARDRGTPTGLWDHNVAECVPLWDTRLCPWSLWARRQAEAVGATWSNARQHVWIKYYFLGLQERVINASLQRETLKNATDIVNADTLSTKRGTCTKPIISTIFKHIERRITNTFRACLYSWIWKFKLNAWTLKMWR